jgi:hypothetical protein
MNTPYRNPLPQKLPLKPGTLKGFRGEVFVLGQLDITGFQAACATIERTAIMFQEMNFADGLTSGYVLINASTPEVGISFIATEDVEHRKKRTGNSTEKALLHVYRYGA